MEDKIAERDKLICEMAKIIQSMAQMLAHTDYFSNELDKIISDTENKVSTINK